MRNRIASPEANRQDRDALAWLICRIRPDWKRASVAAVLSRARYQQLDQLAISAIIAAATRPDQDTPEALARIGDHTLAALAALDRQPTPTAPQHVERGPDCAQCVASAWRHGPDGRRPGCPGYQPDTSPTPRATPAGLARARQIRDQTRRTHAETPEDRS